MAGMERLGTAAERSAWRRVDVALMGLAALALLLPSLAWADQPDDGTAAGIPVLTANFPAGTPARTSPTALTDSLTLGLSDLAWAAGGLAQELGNGSSGLLLDYQHRVSAASTVELTGLFNRYETDWSYYYDFDEPSAYYVSPVEGPLPSAQQTVFALGLGWRWYLLGRALRRLYFESAVVVTAAVQGGDPVPPAESAFDYEYGLDFRLGYVWEPFDAWCIDLGAGVQILDDAAHGYSGILNADTFGGAEQFPYYQVDLLSLRMGYAWAGSGGAAPGPGTPAAFPAGSAPSAPGARRWWDPSSTALEPFYGYSFLDMPSQNRELKQARYSGTFTGGREIGLDAPLGFGSFLLTPRAYALDSDTVTQPEWGAGATTYALALELGAGYRLDLGPFSLEADAFGGALYGYWMDHFDDDSPLQETYGGAWTPVAEGQLGVRYHPSLNALGLDFRSFVLGVDVDYRYAYLAGWRFTRSEDLSDGQMRAHTYTSTLPLDFDGTSVLGSVGYRF